ncbi:glutaminyl-peptide cyclotransferase [Sphingomonas japonica]|uniref:Glutamine cyclotransferase n=1 Tax=Sphingomonas japonica TaxID=511662 RepID=A0ABX0U0B5_9SPHN|nr:glutaminyl-peptide cyclotransferase [Sphingomonas japonica]NIJ24014.1 glutamine cyclotransferase [Sphingomonas japonica]
MPLPAQQVAAPVEPATTAAATTPVRYETATVVARYPHDPAAFTQGLLWHAGKLYESTGHETESEIRRVDLASGRVEARAQLPADQFGEGLARWGDELISLTWTEGVANRWDIDTLRAVGASRYPGEGWGLAATDDSLVLSDGTADLRFVDPQTFAERRRVTVTLEGRPIPQINELEVIDGQVWANIWFSGFLIAIDPATGHVVRAVDLRPLVKEVGLADRDAVLNGIAWDAAGKRLFVTGKNWPTLFEIRIDPDPVPPPTR